MYNNMYGFNPNPYENRLNYLQQMQNQNQKMDITTVNGRNGADAFSMPPNSRVLLLDQNEPILYLKSTDGAGYAKIEMFSITPYIVEKPIDTKSLESRISRLEEIINAKSDSNCIEQTAATADRKQSIADAPTV